jgi:hypothetical protein
MDSRDIYFSLGLHDVWVYHNSKLEASKQQLVECVIDVADGIRNE